MSPYRRDEVALDFSEPFITWMVIQNWKKIEYPADIYCNGWEL